MNLWRRAVNLRRPEIKELRDLKDLTKQVGFFPGSYIVINIQMTSTRTSEAFCSGLLYSKKSDDRLDVTRTERE